MATELSELHVGQVIDIEYGDDTNDIAIVVQDGEQVVALVSATLELIEIDAGMNPVVISDDVFLMIAGEEDTSEDESGSTE